MRKPLAICVLFLVAFTVYLIGFPDDFFISLHPYKKNSAQFTYSRTPTKLILYDKTKVNDQLLQIIRNPDPHIAASTHVIKDNEKRTVVKIEGEQPAILKRYNIANLYDWFTKCPFRSSKAQKSWYYQFALLNVGIASARPIALVEKRWGPLWRETYLISEYLDGQPLDQLIETLNEQEYKEITDEIAKVNETFYKLNWLHRDFVARNIIVGESRLFIIDVDEMHSYAFKNKIYKDKFYKKHILKPLNRSQLSIKFTPSSTANQKDCIQSINSNKPTSKD